MGRRHTVCGLDPRVLGSSKSAEQDPALPSSSSGLENIPLPQASSQECYGYSALGSRILKKFKLSYKCNIFLVIGPVQSHVFGQLFKKSPFRIKKNSNEARIQFILGLSDEV